MAFYSCMPRGCQWNKSGKLPKIPGNNDNIDLSINDPKRVKSLTNTIFL